MRRMPEFSNPDILPERWRGFLRELDVGLVAPTEVHCLGGFVVTLLYGVARDTGDLDALAVLPREQRGPLLELAGLGSSLSRKYKVFLEQVGVADYPEEYESRLVSLWPGFLSRLNLRALEIHDVALAKLSRNNNKDQFDIRQLAQQGHLNPDVLRERYYRELRSYLIGPVERHDLTLKLWVEEYFSQ